MNYQFYKDLLRGRQAEVLVTEAFNTMGFFVEDVTENPEYWDKDIDLIIYGHDGTPHTFEVKADWNLGRTGNVVLELIGQTGNAGWYITTEATHLAFCDMENRICYIARTNELRNYTYNQSNLPHITLNNCECILVNVNDCNLFQRIRI